jgi:hypothetical protein
MSEGQIQSLQVLLAAFVAQYGSGESSSLGSSSNRELQRVQTTAASLELTPKSIFETLDYTVKRSISIPVTVKSLRVFLRCLSDARRLAEREESQTEACNEEEEKEAKEREKKDKAAAIFYKRIRRIYKFLSIFRNSKDAVSRKPNANWKMHMGIYEFCHFMNRLENGERLEALNESDDGGDDVDTGLSMDDIDIEEGRVVRLYSVSTIASREGGKESAANSDVDDPDASSPGDNSEVEEGADEQQVGMESIKNHKKGVKTAGKITEGVDMKLRPVPQTRMGRRAPGSTGTSQSNQASGQSRAGRMSQTSTRVTAGMMTSITDTFVTYGQKVGLWVAKMDVPFPAVWGSLTHWLQWPALGWEVAIIPVKGSWFYWLLLIGGLIYPIVILFILAKDDGKPIPAHQSLGHCFGIRESILVHMRTRKGGDSSSDSDSSDESGDDDDGDDEEERQIFGEDWSVKKKGPVQNDDAWAAPGQIKSDVSPTELYREFNRWRSARFLRSNIFGAGALIIAALSIHAATNSAFGMESDIDRSQAAMLGALLVVLSILNYGWTSAKVWALKKFLVHHNYSLLPAHREMRILVCTLIIMALRSMLFMALSALNDILMGTNATSIETLFINDPAVIMAIILILPFTIVGPYAYFIFVDYFYRSDFLMRMRKLADGDDEIMRGLMERFAIRETEASMGVSILVTTSLSVFNDRNFHFASLQMAERVLVVIMSTYLEYQPLAQIITLVCIEGGMLIAESIARPYSSALHAKYSLAFRIVTLSILAMLLWVHLVPDDTTVLIITDVVLCACFFGAIVIFVIAMDVPSLLAFYKEYLATRKFRGMDVFVESKSDFNKRRLLKSRSSSAASRDIDGMVLNSKQTPLLDIEMLMNNEIETSLTDLTASEKDARSTGANEDEDEHLAIAMEEEEVEIRLEEEKEDRRNSMEDADYVLGMTGNEGALREEDMGVADHVGDAAGKLFNQAFTAVCGADSHGDGDDGNDTTAEEELLTGGFREELLGRARKKTADLCLKRDFYALGDNVNLRRLNHFYDQQQLPHVCVASGWTMLQIWQYLKAADVVPGIKDQLLEYELLVSKGPLFSIASSRIGGRIPHSISSMLCVESLSLQGASLSCSLEALASMPSLRNLILDKNAWVDVPAGLKNLTQVEVLSYRDNHTDAFRYRRSQAFLVTKPKRKQQQPPPHRSRQHGKSKDGENDNSKKSNSGRRRVKDAMLVTDEWEINNSHENTIYQLPTKCRAHQMAPFDVEFIKSKGAMRNRRLHSRKKRAITDEEDTAVSAQSESAILREILLKAGCDDNDDAPSPRCDFTNRSRRLPRRDRKRMDQYFGSPAWTDYRISIIDKETDAYLALLDRLSDAFRGMTSLRSLHLDGTLDGLRHPRPHNASTTRLSGWRPAGHAYSSLTSTKRELPELVDRSSYLEEEEHGHPARIVRPHTTTYSDHHQQQQQQQQQDHGTLNGDGDDNAMLLWCPFRWYGRPLPEIALLRQIRERGLQLSHLYHAKVPVRLLMRNGFRDSELLSAGYSKQALRPYSPREKSGDSYGESGRYSFFSAVTVAATNKAITSHPPVDDEGEHEGSGNGKEEEKRKGGATVGAAKGFQLYDIHQPLVQ